MEKVDDDFFISDDGCSFFLCLDSIHAHDADGLHKEVGEGIMLADIRDHSVAGQCLPDAVTGYWVRFFGPKRKYTLNFSVWKNIAMEYKEAVHDSPHKQQHHQLQHAKQHTTTTTTTKKVVKIGEKSIVVWNSGPEGKTLKRKNKKKNPNVSFTTKTLKKTELVGSDSLPSFCCQDKYNQIVTSLRDCIENAKYEQFEQLYENFQRDVKENDRDSTELKLLLWCERSQLYAVQGRYPDAKKWLQKVVDNVVAKSPNKLFLLNRAYLLLASTHVQEGNNGTAEECLGVIQPDKKNGVPYEDVSLYHLLRGIVFLNFGKQLPRLSKFLWAESKQSFEASETNFKKCIASTFHSYCRMQLNLARLLIYQSTTRSTTHSDFVAPEKRVAAVESSVGISLRVACLTKMVRGEMCYHLKQKNEGDELLTSAQQMAEGLGFCAEGLLCESIRKCWNEVQYKEFIDSLDEERLSKAVRNCRMMMGSHTYSADESSM